MASTTATSEAYSLPTGPRERGAGGGAAREGARDAEAGAGERHRLLLFAVGGRLYGCPIEAVREIIPFRRCTRLPGAPPYVCGLINLRGTIVTVLDLGLRLGAAAVTRTEGSIILVEHGTKVVGLGVDELRDVQSLAADEVDAPSGADDAGGILRGLGHIGDDVVVLLDVRTIVKHVLL